MSKTTQPQLTLDQIYSAFCKWYVLPIETRSPKTIPEFAEKMEIPLPQIVEFTDRDTFSQDILIKAKEWGKSKIPELLNDLYKRYKEKHNPNDLRMYKELLELDKEVKTGPTINFTVFSPSDDQYRQIIARESRSLALPSSPDPLIIHDVD